MHDALTPPCRLRIAWVVTGGVHGEELKRAAVPVLPAYAFIGVALILNVEAVACRAEVGTGSAADASFGDLFPEMAFKVFRVCKPCRAGFKVKEHWHFCRRGSLLCALFQKRCYGLKRFVAFLGQFLYQPSLAGSKRAEKNIGSLGAVGPKAE